MSQKHSKYPTLPLLIVDDDVNALHTIEIVLKENGVNNYLLCQDPHAVVKLMTQQQFCLVLMDLKMPGISGEELLLMINQRDPHLPVIILTGTIETETAVRCIKNNAFDYLVKPIDESQLIPCLKRCISFREMAIENQNLKRSILSEDFKHPEIFQQLLTKNSRMMSIYRYAEAIAASPAPILFIGEAGVGKRFMAQIIHQLSRRSGEFVYIDTAAISDSAFRSHIFGALEALESPQKKNEFALYQARNGILYFNEIAGISLDHQAELCRLIQTRKYYFPATKSYKRTHVRIVFATRYNPMSLISEHRLRYDLYNAINSHSIEIPPLRKRHEDLPLLLEHFIDLAAQEQGKTPPKLPPEVGFLLAMLSFKGNIAELKQMALDVVAVTDSGKIKIEAFERFLDQERQDLKFLERDMFQEERTSVSGWSKLPTLREMDHILVHEAMRRTGDNRSLAAKVLGITRQTLVKYLPEEELASEGILK